MKVRTIRTPLLLLSAAVSIASCTMLARCAHGADYESPHGFKVAFKPLSAESAITEGLWQIENAIDIQQTLRIARNPDQYQEVGTLALFSGPHPTVRQVWVVSLAFGVLHYTVTRGIENLVDENPDYRVLQRLWSYSSLAYKTWNMQHNASIGLGY